MSIHYGCRKARCMPQRVAVGLHTEKLRIFLLCRLGASEFAGVTCAVTRCTIASLRMQKGSDAIHAHKGVSLAGAYVLEHDPPFRHVAVTGPPQAQQIRVVVPLLARHGC